MVRRNELRELFGTLTRARDSPRCNLSRASRRVSDFGSESVGTVAQEGVAESELELVGKARWVDRHNQFPKPQASKELADAGHGLPTHGSDCPRPEDPPDH